MSSSDIPEFCPKDRRFCYPELHLPSPAKPPDFFASRVVLQCLLRILCELFGSLLKKLELARKRGGARGHPDPAGAALQHREPGVEAGEAGARLASFASGWVGFGWVGLGSWVGFGWVEGGESWLGGWVVGWLGGWVVGLGGGFEECFWFFAFGKLGEIELQNPFGFFHFGPHCSH